MRLWRLRLSVEPPKVVPRDALKGRPAICPAVYVCSSPCGYAYRFLGNDRWIGPYWPKKHDWEEAHDGRGEWSGYPREMTTEFLSEQYVDCFGRLVLLEGLLDRGWSQ